MIVHPVGGLSSRRGIKVSTCLSAFAVLRRGCEHIGRFGHSIERLNNPTPLTQAVMSGGFKNTSRTVCRRAARAGRFSGSMVVTLRFREAVDSAALVSLGETLTRDPGVASAELWKAVDGEVGSAATDERLRGGDKTIHACFTVDTLRESKAKAIASNLSGQFPAAEIAVYRLL
jgi:hypothetical protein